ncbi:MAG: PH domain-containing protein [Ectothiorhodospiraceae bacterium]|nr:PH domain-containing protein [Ectothiorhodospiraceae bacterium]
MTEADNGTAWQRLSPWAVLFLLVRGIVDFIRQNLPVVIGAGAWVAFVERVGMQQLLAIGATLLALALSLTLLYYRRFRFRLDDDVLRVQKGLIRQVEVRIRAQRIQQLALEQPAWMRPFDIVRLSLDTPGGVTTEVELPGIRRSLAEELSKRLDSARQQGAGDQSAPASTKPDTLFRITPVALTLHGLSSNAVYLLLAAIGPFLRPLEGRIRERLEREEPVPWLQPLADTPWLSVPLLLGALLLALMMVSVGAAWLRYFRYTLTRQGRYYVQRSGLLNRRQQTLSADRLQAVEQVQTMLGRLLGRYHLVCRQYGGPQPADQAGRSFLVPGLDRGTANRLSVLFLPGLEPREDLQPVHRAYRRALALRYTAVIGLTGLALAVWQGSGWWFLLTGGALAATWPVAHLRWRLLAWAVGRDHLIVRRGLLGQRTTLFPVERVHAVQLRQSWFQRRLTVATVQLTLASGPVLLPWLRESQARALADWVLYRVETRELPPAVPGTMTAGAAETP